MTEATEIAQFRMETTFSDNPIQEITKLAEEYIFGNALRERAFLRMWRVWRRGLYLMVESEDPDDAPGTPMYPTWTSFQDEVLVPLGAGRASLYSRLRAYSQLDFLGYTEDEMLEMMTSRPYIYTRALNRMIKWDAPNSLPEEIMGKDVDEIEDQDESIADVRDVLEGIASTGSLKDVESYIDHDVLGRPEVRVTLEDGGIITVVYSENYIDEDGVLKMGQSGMAMFTSDVQVPAYVEDELARRLRVLKVRE